MIHATNMYHQKSGLSQTRRASALSGRKWGNDMRCILWMAYAPNMYPKQTGLCTTRRA